MDSSSTRRFLRYHTHTPVFIAVPGCTNTVVPGLVSKLSRSGMEIYAGVNLQPGETMEVEFRTSAGTIHMSGVVRNRSGYCFGLEFSEMRVEIGKPARIVLT